MSRGFDEASDVGPWVPLPDVMALGIAAYSRRFEDLRKVYGEEYGIENKTERGHDGVTRSWYRKFRKARWSERPRVATNNRGEVLSPFELVP